ncbi:MAG: DMT family transporter [Caldilineales bacterium]
MRRAQLAADGALLFVTAVWGATFVMVQDAVTGFPVFAFLALRFSLATLLLLPWFLRSSQPAVNHVLAGGAGTVEDRPDLNSRSGRSLRDGSQSPTVPGWHTRWIALWPGIAIGLALAAGYAFQTFGLRFTTPAKAGFITGLSVALVPIGQAIFLRRAPRLNSIAGVALATLGLGLLSLNADLRVNLGDLLVLGCAVAFAAHILLVGRFAPDWNPLRLAFVQIATVAVVTAILALIFERPIGWPPPNVWFAAAFTGLFATALAFFIQSRAQQATTPTHTALIFAAEPVFAGIFSYLLIGEVLGPRQIAGAALIVAGMLVAELWRRNRDQYPVISYQSTDR